MQKSHPLEISVSIKQEFDIPEDVDCFLDEFVSKIESLGMMCGGGSNVHVGVHNHAISFVEDGEGENETRINEKLRDLQRWILNHRFNPAILLWKKWDETDDD